MHGMRTAVLAALVLSVCILPAWAGSICEYVGPPREATCVCNQTYCRIKPGTTYHFYALFAGPRALTSTGAMGVWRPIRVRPHRFRKRS